MRFFVFLAGLCLGSIADAIPLYSQREGLACLYCHTSAESKHLNEAGSVYSRNGHFFPQQMKPKVSEEFYDSQTDPKYRLLRSKYLKKYFQRDPILEMQARGKRLFYGTAEMKRQSSKSCASCHNPEDIAQINKSYPRYVPLMEKVVSLEQMQNYCIEVHLGGRPYALGSEDSLSISAYINSIESEE